ncbi:MAG: hypothetical protein HY400_00065 [Elusimicrobia bacterium]|nr:hypothetical protein [Elusimicrobiota bacterium]
MKHLLVALLLGLDFQFSWAAPYHPDVLKKVEEGEIDSLYSMKQQSELRQRGLDQPGEFLLKRFLESQKPGSKDPFRVLVLLVDFKDQRNQTEPVFFQNLFSSWTASMQQLFLENFYGNLESIEVNDLSSLGWQRAPQKYAYYVNNQQGMGEYPWNVSRLVQDMVNQMDPLIDFSQYDNNRDGVLDALILVHAGPGAELTNSNDDMLSHTGTIPSMRLDGINIRAYTLVPEYRLEPGDLYLVLPRFEKSDPRSRKK